jgi:transposase-like protein
MTRKTYTIGEKIATCQKAIQAEKEGTSLHKFAESLEITDFTLYKWVKEFRAGKLTGEPTKKEEIPVSLIKGMQEELNGPTEPEKITAFIQYKDNKESYIPFETELPDGMSLRDLIDHIKTEFYNGIVVSIYGMK